MLQLHSTPMLLKFGIIAGDDQDTWNDDDAFVLVLSECYLCWIVTVVIDFAL